MSGSEPIDLPEPDGRHQENPSQENPSQKNPTENETPPETLLMNPPMNPPEAPPAEVPPQPNQPDVSSSAPEIDSPIGPPANLNRHWGWLVLLIMCWFAWTGSRLEPSVPLFSSRVARRNDTPRLSWQRVVDAAQAHRRRQFSLSLAAKGEGRTHTHTYRPSGVKGVWRLGFLSWVV